MRDEIRNIVQHIQEPDIKWEKFLALLEEYYDYYMSRILGLKTILSPAETEFPAELAQSVGAYVVTGDDARAIARKTALAVFHHQNKSRFDLVWKPLIDTITGGDSEVYDGVLHYGSFIVEESFIESNSRIGYLNFSDYKVYTPSKGEIHIDIKAQVTPEQAATLSHQLKPITPIFMRIFIGNLEVISPGSFIVEGSLIEGSDLIEGSGGDFFTIFKTILVL